MIRLLLPALALLSIAVFPACEDDPAEQVPFHIGITQPADGAVTRDSVVRVLTSVQSSCSCRTHVEFYVDGVLRSTDVLPEYSYDWTAAGQAGPHTIATRLVVRDEGEMWDSVRVVVDTTRMIAGGPDAR